MITRQTVTTADRAAWLAERFKDVTSTEVAALFGMSSRCTAYELACLKAGTIEDTFERTERTDWGTHLEDYIARRIGRVYGVEVRPKKDYMRIVECRMGASFDFEIIGITDDVIEDNRLRQAYGQYGLGLLEIKNVDYFIFREQWTMGAQPEAPQHIEIQLQAQLEVSGYGWGCIAALVGGNKLEIILRLRDEAVGGALRNAVVMFWTNLGNGIYPPIELPEDADIIRQLYNYAEPGKVIDARGDNMPVGLALWFKEYTDAAADEKKCKDRKSTAQAKLLMLIGEAEKVLTDFGTISAGMVAPAEIPACTRAGYRNLRCYPKK